MSSTVKVTTKAGSGSYEIRIGGGLLSKTGEWAAKALPNKACSVAIVSNKKVFGLYGDLVVRSLSQHGFRPVVHLIGDGERFKNLRTLEKALAFFGKEKLTRTDAVVALGGGVVGDLAGFAASAYLRGVGFLQIPTTLLSMIDSSVGGKVGVNMPFGKNMVGAFYQPKGVLIDPGVLQTLPKREFRAGLCEAVKHAALGGGRLFDMTGKVLSEIDTRSPASITGIGPVGKRFEQFLAEQVKFKAAIVSGDEKEAVEKSDARSRKVLNFGHTFAHALEKVTNYRYLKHGEAVGYGILFAAELSKKLELFDRSKIELLNDVVHRVGKLPRIEHIDAARVMDAFHFDKKSLAGDLQWVLLQDIGKPVIVRQSSIPTRLIRNVLKRFIPG